MNIRYRITVTSEEREQLRSLVQVGKGPVRSLKRAQILLAAASGSGDAAIAANVSVGTRLVTSLKLLPLTVLGSCYFRPDVPGAEALLSSV